MFPSAWEFKVSERRVWTQNNIKKRKILKFNSKNSSQKTIWSEPVQSSLAAEQIIKQLLTSCIIQTLFFVWYYLYFVMYILIHLLG